MKAFSTEYVGQYKSGFVHEVFTKSVPKGIILLFASVTASQRLREPPHKVWIIRKPSGEVLCSYCSFTAGYSKCCNHVIAVLYKIQPVCGTNQAGTSSLGRLRTWTYKPTKDKT
ncbi:hypothetical protein pdam_00024450 [Pocillopora damicornis]|uniref:SWIM-type domain-containing protein n=1 Tax=Pocillopora damicornis TaxID=46731 RepID=A0A3M6TZZ0_POCDA|nr:hypothetical protein pdam_00024450 [Pocillopora damicornis]